MIIIFGWQRERKKFDDVMKVDCYHCQNHGQWFIWKETEWVSLFFVKLLPFINKYFIACRTCGDSTAISSNEAKQALNSNRRTTELHDALVAKIEKNQFQGLTEGQITYRKTQLDRKKNA